jgi:hypothetical protein
MRCILLILDGLGDRGQAAFGGLRRLMGLGQPWELPVPWLPICPASKVPVVTERFVELSCRA